MRIDCKRISRIFAPTGRCSGEPFASIRTCPSPQRENMHRLVPWRPRSRPLENELSSPGLSKHRPYPAHITVTMPVWCYAFSGYVVPSGLCRCGGRDECHGPSDRVRTQGVSHIWGTTVIQKHTCQGTEGEKASFERMLVACVSLFQASFVWLLPGHRVTDSKGLEAWRPWRILSLRPDGSWPSTPCL